MALACTQGSPPLAPPSRACHHHGLSNQPKKGGTFLMRHESTQVDAAMIGAPQECLLSVSPR
jgi:hypothetical protein